MLYLGIDIGKNNHEAGIINDDGTRNGKSLRFANTAEGFEKLLKFIETKRPAEDELRIGMEATGHYWLALYSFLHKQAFSIAVINPIQSDSLRNFYIRQVKTDAVDCFLIADVIRFGRYAETHLADEDMVALRNLARLRESIVDTCADYKRQVIAILDQVFPEYEKLFSNVFGESSKAFLKTCGTPEQCIEISTKKLSALLQKTSRGRFGLEKAQQLKAAAQSSCGVDLATDAFSFQIRILVEQIEFTEGQIDKIDREIRKQLEKINTVILSIPGVGPAIGAVILGEIGDINRFDNPKKLVSFAGIDPTVMQSGNYTGAHNRLSKRGSPFLRRAIWMAAVTASRVDPVFKAFYEKKRSEGKTHGTALGAVARKLTYTIHAVLKANQPYEVRLNPDP
jgi:transposase